MTRIITPPYITSTPSLTGRLHCDEKELLEPNLLIPGKKPVGPVVLDWSNHFLKTRPWLLTLCDGRNLIEEFSLGSIIEGSYGVYEGSKGVKFNNAANQGISLGAPSGGKMFTGTASGAQHTVLCVAAPQSSSSQRDCVINQRNSSDYYGFHFNASDDLSITAGAVGFGGNAFSGQSSGRVHIASGITGKISAYCISRNGASYVGSIDGQTKSVTVSSSPAYTISTNGEINIGDLGNFSGTGYGMRYPIYLLYVVNKSYSQTEINVLTGNPYQLFKAA